MKTARSTSDCTGMDETTGIGTKSGTIMGIGDGAEWVAVEERRRACVEVEEGCTPVTGGVRTRTIGGVDETGSVTTSGIDTTATIGMHRPGEVTTGITGIGTGVTVRTRISEDIPPEAVPTTTECHPVVAAGVAPATIPPGMVVPIVMEHPEEDQDQGTLWTIGTAVDAEDQVGEEAAAVGITTVEGNRLRRPILKPIFLVRNYIEREYSGELWCCCTDEKRESETKSNFLAALPVRSVFHSWV